MVASGGFSLLEILVAFVILSLVLGVIMRIFSGALNNIGQADHYAHATLLAESVLDSLGVESPLTAGEQSGKDDQGYRWDAKITPFADPDAVFDPQTNPVALYRIDLDVKWGPEGSDKPGLQLITLRAAPRS